MNLKKQLKIALIVRKYSTSGGTERYTYTISKYLAEQGHKVTIFCSKAKISPPNKNITIKKFFTFPGRITKTLMFYYLTQLIDLKSFDIVQGSGKVIKQDIYRTGGGTHLQYLKYQKKRNRLNYYDKIVLSIEKKIFNPLNTKLIISVSKFVSNFIIDYFNYPIDKIVTLYNFVDTEFFFPSNNYHKRNNLKLLFVANDFELKGLKNIIHALKYVDNVELNVVGNDNKEKFINLSLKLNVHNKIHFLGEKRGKDLVKCYQENDILIHPTYFDSFGFVCLEALSCGLPVIVSKNAGVSEIIDNYRDGIVLNSPENINELINAISYFKNHSNLYLSKTLARKKAMFFNIDSYVKNLLDIYKEVIKLKK